MYLEQINGPADVKKLNLPQMQALAAEMRTVLLQKLSRHGGHIGPNLGMVEATIALHAVFDSPKDKLVFDVSHQSYPHKMLTGRKDAYLYEEHYDDVSGYSEPDESEHDHFVIGHTSTSVSLACGLAKGRDLLGKRENIIAIIGDGSLSGGEALEGIDFASELHSNLIIVVNDNDMSIAENHGGLYGNLKLLRETDGRAACNLFRAMGLDYLFVKDGNDIAALISAFRRVQDIDHPVVVHICTKKGKGYAPAEQDRETWHWSMPFELETGKPLVTTEGEDYSGLTAQYLLERMKKDPAVVGITSATPPILGFTPDKRREAGRHFVDVGIAEETAVALASGIAANGGKPVYGVYSTFIQRAYDQISQDLCINNNPATILVFAASVYGMNDVTHLGIYDIPMLSHIPNLVYLAPATKEEYLAILDWSIDQTAHPVAIRVPMEVVSSGVPCEKDFSRLNQYETVQTGSRVAILGVGGMLETARDAAKRVAEASGVQPTIIHPMFLTGTDDALLESLKASHDVVITIEDGVIDGGFGERIARFYGSSDMKVRNYGLKKEFLDRYNAEAVVRKNRLTAGQIAEDLLALL